MEKSLTGKEKILDDYWELVDEYGDHPKNCLKYLHNKPDECDCEQYDVLKDLILKYGEERFQEGRKETKFSVYQVLKGEITRVDIADIVVEDIKREAIETFKKELIEKIRDLKKKGYEPDNILTSLELDLTFKKS